MSPSMAQDLLDQARSQFASAALLVKHKRLVLAAANQLLIDLMDVLEQTEEETPVIMAQKSMEAGIKALPK